MLLLESKDRSIFLGVLLRPVRRVQPRQHGAGVQGGLQGLQQGRGGRHSSRGDQVSFFNLIFLPLFSLMDGWMDIPAEEIK